MSKKDVPMVIKMGQIINYLKIDEKYIPRIMKKSCGVEVTLEAATSAQLNDLYRDIKPLYHYVATCRKLNLSDKRIFQYAEIDTGTEVTNFNQLVFVIDQAAYKRLKYLLTDELAVV